jgi:hypothetical protein
MVRYFGVFSSHARLRPHVVPVPPEPAVNCDGHAGGETPTQASVKRRLSWALLMARVFEIDVLECGRCGQKGMQRIAFITQPHVIRAMLSCLGLATGPPQRKPARRSVQQELDLADAWI